MRPLLFAPAVLRTLATRAAVTWALVRALVTAVFLLMPPSTIAGGAARPPHPSPVAVVVICAIVGVADLLRRREGMLWLNLGVSTTQLALAFVAAAASGEIILALARG